MQRSWSTWVTLLALAGLFVGAHVGWAQDPPPPPGAAHGAGTPGAAAPSPATTSAAATAWACTRATLLDDVPCTVEGRTAPQVASREQAKEHQREARLFGEDLCRTLARIGEPDEDLVLQDVCMGRVAVATKRCGGDGSRRLLDDAGRFNPGHGRCYASLASTVRDMRALAELAGTCCACAEERCGARVDRCTARIATGAAPEVGGQCLASTCSAECAALQLVQRKP